MKSKKKQPSMQIKRPSLKGMKNTKYLGHFAQDGYIQKGHNLSGIFDIYRQPSAIEMMAPSNPFDASQERQRRMAQTGIKEEELAGIDPEAQLAAQELERSNRFLSEQERLLEQTGQSTGRTSQEYHVEQARKRRATAQERVGRASKRSVSKKFIEEV
jgi:hypothetical protein